MSDEFDAKQKVEVDPSPVFEKLYPMDEEKKEDLLSEMIRRLNDSIKFMTKLWPKMIENYKRYRSIAEPIRGEDGKEDLSEPNVFVPHTFAYIESTMPRIGGKLPKAKAFPRKGYPQAKADAIQDLTYYSFDRDNWVHKQVMWQRQFEIYGWSPLYCYWRYEEIESYEKVSQPGGERILKKKKIVKWDDWQTKVIDVFDSYLQPGVTDPEGGDWFFFREWLSKKDIKKKVDAGILYKEVGEWLEDNPTPTKSNRNDDNGRQLRDDLVGFTKDIADTSYGKYELMYCLEDDRIVTILNRDIIASVSDNPNPLKEKPIINCNLLPQVSEPIGVGTAEAIQGLQDKVNALSNARMKNIALLLNKVFFVDGSVGIDLKNIRMTPGNVMTYNGGDAQKLLKELEVSDISESSQREIDKTEEYIQLTLGISGYTAGSVGDRGYDTATGVSSLIREGNARFSLKSVMFESYPLRRVVKTMHAYNSIHMPDEKTIMVLGPKGWQARDVTIDEIACECEFIIEAGSSVPLDQDLRRESMNNLAPTMVTVPQIVDQGKFFKELLDVNLVRNADEMILARSDEYSMYEDMQMAKAENIALDQGQAIEMVGDDRLHIQIHSEPPKTNNPEAIARRQDHIQAHMAHYQQQLMMAQQASQNQIFGGQNAEQGTSGEGAVGGPVSDEGSAGSV